MSYKYELIVFIDHIQKKRFIGNDMNNLVERFEKWFIKQPYTNEQTTIYKGEIQHASYK